MTTGGSRKDRPIMGYEQAKDALDLNADNDRLRRENSELREALGSLCALQFVSRVLTPCHDPKCRACSAWVKARALL